MMMMMMMVWATKMMMRMMMSVMGWQCIKTGQAPNSKVARTPTLPIPALNCTPV